MHSLIEENSAIWYTDLTVNGYDSYVPSWRCTLDIAVEDATDYLPTLQERLSEIDSHGISFDLYLYYAGMELCEASETGGLAGTILTARERLVFDWCRQRGLPIAFSIGGGYVGHRRSREQLVWLHRLTLEAAAVSAYAGGTPVSGGAP